MSNLVAVYGTLREGQGNYSYFFEGRAELVAREDILRGYTMHTFGGFPCIVRSGNKEDTIVVDVFDLEGLPEISHAVDRMEEGAGYVVAEEVTEQGHHVRTYIYPELSEWMDIPIPSGDWIKFTNEYDRGAY